MAVLQAQGAGAADKKEGVKFSGCSISAAAYMKDMAKAFEEKKGIPVEVKGGGVPVGIANTLSGKSDIGGSCRYLLDAEKKGGATSTIVGYDMLVFIVHPSNPVSSLTMDEVRKVFSGKITNWSEVGGPKESIIVVGRESPDAGVATMFREKVMRGWEISKNTADFQSTGDVEKALETDQYKWGIGVTGISSAGLRKLKMLALNVNVPNRATFLAGSYPLARPLYLVTKGKPEGQTKAFLDFVLSDEGQQLMAKNAFSKKEYCQRQMAMTGTCDEGK